MFVVMFFCLPETLYLRGSTPVVTDKPILRRMKLWGLRPAGKHLKASDFFRQFIMFVSCPLHIPQDRLTSSSRFKYPTVLLTAFYYSVTFTLSSILPAVTSATLFRQLYKFNASQTGLALGLGTLVGSTLGELLGGIVVDRSMYLSRKGKKDGEIVPEVRYVVFRFRMFRLAYTCADCRAFGRAQSFNP
jgi:hypothetical protein